MTNYLDEVKAKINKEFEPEKLILVDNSSLHKKHSSFDSNKFQNFCDQCCEKINIPTFKISYNKIESFLDKNRKKYNFDRILKNE